MPHSSSLLGPLLQLARVLLSFTLLPKTYTRLFCSPRVLRNSIVRELVDAYRVTPTEVFADARHHSVTLDHSRSHLKLQSPRRRLNSVWYSRCLFLLPTVKTRAMTTTLLMKNRQHEETSPEIYTPVPLGYSATTYLTPSPNQFSSTVTAFSEQSHNLQCRVPELGARVMGHVDI
jgi:hypothetical protein